MLEKFGTRTSFENLLNSHFDWKLIPDKKGVYIVSCLPNFLPQYMDKGSGAFVNGKDPNKKIKCLHDKWVEDAAIIYIGKAGGESEKSNLQKRIQQYIRFGLGKKYSHKGGKNIWQLANVRELFVSWYICDNDEDPRELEKQLLHQFEKIYGKLPFANMNH